jgi:hypothetical protein
MPYSVVDKGSKHFNIILRNGGGGTFTGLGFQPDLVWQKARSTASSHYLHDAVRGVQKALFTNSTSAETTYTDQITSFDTDGFTVNSGGDWGSGTTVVDWCWKAGNTSGSSNTAGSITSTVSANTTSGFSVCTYTGDGGTTTSSTIGHGLGVAPKIYFLKGRSEAGDWIVHSSLFTNLQFLKLNLTNAVASGGTAQYGMTSSTICVPARNTSGQTYVAYCFAEVKGFSKFGSYTGNGSTDGTFVYTGFKPAFVMFKRTDSSTGANWVIEDNKRSTYNVVDARLFPNTSDAEVSNGNGKVDFTSNGFKLRVAIDTQNESGATYIYMAFAESPIVSSKGIPTTAR